MSRVRPTANYGVDDFIACLAFVGTPPPMDAPKDRTSAQLRRRLRYHEDVETFCVNWFKDHPIDGQWAGFLKSFLLWQQQERRAIGTVLREGES